MIRKKWFLGLFSLILATFICASCSTATSEADSSDDATTEPQIIDGHTVIVKPSLSSIVGTWKTSVTLAAPDTLNLDRDFDFSETVIKNQTYVINNDGTYILYTIGEYPTTSQFVYWAERGTITMTNGHWEKTSLEIGSPTSDLQNPSTIDWEPDSFTPTLSDDICIIDGKFYTATWRRIGTGSGIVGTWVRIDKFNTYNDPNWILEYHKLEYTINNNEISYKHYTSADQTFGLPTETNTFSYTLDPDGTLTNLTTPQSNKVSILGNVFVYLKNGYTKQ